MTGAAQHREAPGIDLSSDGHVGSRCVADIVPGQAQQWHLVGAVLPKQARLKL